jgi:hypothetical protein
MSKFIIGHWKYLYVEFSLMYHRKMKLSRVRLKISFFKAHNVKEQSIFENYFVRNEPKGGSRHLGTTGNNSPKTYPQCRISRIAPNSS